MQDVVDVGIHSSVFSQPSSEVLVASLSDRELASSILYRGAHSAYLWERLHLAHAPSCQEARSSSLYHQGFAALVERVTERSLGLVSLGCGLAEKETPLFEMAGDRLNQLVLIDASVELLAEAKRRCRLEVPNKAVCAVAADLSRVKDWCRLLPAFKEGGRVFTLFGMVPNFDPKELFHRLSGCMDRGDWLLFDANLRPDAASGDTSIPQNIVDQYDNAECRQWLSASLAELGIYENDGSLRFFTEQSPSLLSVPRIRVVFEFHRDLVTCVGGQRFQFHAGEELGVFYSIRYCRDDIPNLLDPIGIRLVQEWASDSGEDGLYLCQKP